MNTRIRTTGTESAFNYVMLVEMVKRLYAALLLQYAKIFVFITIRALGLWGLYGNTERASQKHLHYITPTSKLKLLTTHAAPAALRLYERCVVEGDDIVFKGDLKALEPIRTK